MPILLMVVILGVLSATLIMLRINKRERQELNKQEDEDNDQTLSGDVIDMRYYEGGIEDEDILGKAHKN